MPKKPSQAYVRRALGMTTGEWCAVQEAAKDAHVHPIEYCRLMVLAAAGTGGVTEHLERAIAAGEAASEPFEWWDWH